MCESVLNHPLASLLTCLLLSLILFIYFFVVVVIFFLVLSWSPPETKDSAIDSPDAQRQEWFAQYFSFWLTTNLQNTTRIQHVNQTWKRKKKKKTLQKKEKKCSNYLFFIVIDGLEVQFTSGSVGWNWTSWFGDKLSLNSMSLIFTLVKM